MRQPLLLARVPGVGPWLSSAIISNSLISPSSSSSSSSFFVPPPVPDVAGGLLVQTVPRSTWTDIGGSAAAYLSLERGGTAAEPRVILPGLPAGSGNDDGQEDWSPSKWTLAELRASFGTENSNNNNNNNNNNNYNQSVAGVYFHPTSPHAFKRVAGAGRQAMRNITATELLNKLLAADAAAAADNGSGGTATTTTTTTSVLFEAELSESSAEVSGVVAAIRRQVLPFPSALVGVSQRRDRPPTPTTYINMATAGASEVLHYDDADAVHYQAVGHRRFWLIAPQHAADLHPYPESDPSRGYAQAPWRPVPGARKASSMGGDLSFLAYPFVSDISSVHVADVGPGESLVLPADWHAYSQAITSSVAVIVRTPGPSAAVLELALDPPLPFIPEEPHDDWAKLETRRFALQFYLPFVIRLSLRGPPECPGDAFVCGKTFAHRLVRSKYRPLFPQGATVTCSDRDAEGINNYLRSYFNDLALLFRTLPRPQRSVALTRWAENLLAEVDFEPAEQGAFLDQCLDWRVEPGVYPRDS